MSMWRIFGFVFLLLLAGSASAGQNVLYYINDTTGGTDEPGLAHYRTPSDACVVGVLKRKVRAYQEGSHLNFRYTAVFVSGDVGFGEFQCNSTIEEQLNIPGANWVTVEAVGTLVYGPFGTADSCTLAGLADTGNTQCRTPKCTGC